MKTNLQRMLIDWCQHTVCDLGIVFGILTTEAHCEGYQTVAAAKGSSYSLTPWSQSVGRAL